MKIRELLLTVYALVAAPYALATSHQHDANDLWIVPEESGWGLNLFHQGDTLFGSLFVYGPDGRARWYTASSLVGDDGGPFHDRPSMYNGALYNRRGPRSARRSIRRASRGGKWARWGSSSGPISSRATTQSWRTRSTACRW